MFQRCMCLCEHFVLFRHMFSYWSQPIYQIYLYAETFKYHMVITWSICPVAKLPYGTSVLYPGVIWPARCICGVSGTQYFFSSEDTLWLLWLEGAICSEQSWAGDEEQTSWSQLRWLLSVAWWQLPLVLAISPAVALTTSSTIAITSIVSPMAGTACSLIVLAAVYSTNI